MSKRLKKDEFLPFAPEGRGVRRINHDSPLCAGASKSLLISRKADGAVTAHCFRCGARGFHGPGIRHIGTQYGHQEAEDQGYEYRDGVTLPRDLTTDYPDEVAAWLRKTGPLEQAVSWGIEWSPSKEQLYIPVVQETMALGPKAVGSVLRRFEPKRYLTLTSDKDAFWGLLRGPQGHSGKGGTILLVEDMLSARKGALVTDTLALLGVNLKPQALRFVLEEGYKEAVVWLDADNPNVRMAARGIARQLPIPTRIIETQTDPKSEPEQFIRNMVRPLTTAQ